MQDTDYIDYYSLAYSLNITGGQLFWAYRIEDPVESESDKLFRDYKGGLPPPKEKKYYTVPVKSPSMPLPKFDKKKFIDGLMHIAEHYKAVNDRSLSD